MERLLRVLVIGANGGVGRKLLPVLRDQGLEAVAMIRDVDAVRAAGVGRFVLVSSMGADDPDVSPELRHYLVAKAIA